MSKSKRHKRSKSKRTKRAILKYSSRKRKGLARGPNSDPISPNGLVSCSICDNKFNRNTMLVPSGCPNTIMPGKKRPFADRSHRVCQNCWWPQPGNPDSGFARVDGPHGCPGCKRGLPPNPPLKQVGPIEVIDLLSSSD